MPTILKDLQTGVCRTEFELEQGEYVAMGRVTAQWAYLEHGIYAVTLAICTGRSMPLPTDALNFSFTRRLRAFRLLVEEVIEEPMRARLLNLVSKIANAEQDRHKITHAMWDWDGANPDRIKASSFRPGIEFEKKFDAARMNALADQIGQISFELEYPGGWGEMVTEMLEAHTDENGHVAFAHISRNTHRVLSSLQGLDQKASAQAMPPEDTHLPPSLKG